MRYGISRRRSHYHSESRPCHLEPLLPAPPSHGMKTRRGRAMAIAVGVGLSWQEARQIAIHLPKHKRHGRLTDEEQEMIRKRARSILLKTRHN